MDEAQVRARRAARNEALLRETNERIEQTAEAFGSSGFEALCECSKVECVSTFFITFDQYEHVRARGESFALIPGHEDLEVERVAERQDGFIIVEKTGEGREIAQALDPRQDPRPGFQAPPGR